VRFLGLWGLALCDRDDGTAPLDVRECWDSTEAQLSNEEVRARFCDGGAERDGPGDVVTRESDL